MATRHNNFEHIVSDQWNRERAIKDGAHLLKATNFQVHFDDNAPSSWICIRDPSHPVAWSPGIDAPAEYHYDQPGRANMSHDELAKAAAWILFAVTASEADALLCLFKPSEPALYLEMQKLYQHNVNEDPVDLPTMLES